MAACSAAIQAAGSIVPGRPAGPAGGIPGGLVPGGLMPPAVKAPIHLPIISMNSGSAAVAAICSCHRSWKRFARSSRSAASFLPVRSFPSLMAGEYTGGRKAAPAVILSPTAPLRGRVAALIYAMQHSLKCLLCCAAKSVMLRSNISGI